MRWRVATLLAVFGIAGIPAASDAAPSSGTPMLHLAVKPSSGSSRTHFVISFRAAETTGRVGPVHRAYRVTADDPARAGCQSSASVQAPTSKAGADVRVVLSPSGSGGWCPGTFRGELWNVITITCPPGEACPAILPRPRLVGRFTFRVTRG